MLSLHKPDGLHRIALFLPSCGLLGLYTFRFCLTACLFCLPAYFLRFTGGILALPLLSPRFIGTPLFRRNRFCQSRLTALVCGKELISMGQFLAMQLLPGIKPFHQFLLCLFGHYEGLRGIRHRNGRCESSGGHSYRHVERNDGSPLDTSQQGKDMLQSLFRRLGLDLQLPAAFHGNQGGIDFSDGFGNAFLCVCHRVDRRDGVFFDLRLAHLGNLFLVKAFGIGPDFLAVQRLTGIDGQADDFGKGGNIRKQPLDTFQLLFTFFRIDGQAVIEITLLTALGTEHAVDLVHHILDVRDGRGQGRFRLYQLAYRLTEGNDLLGALRGVHVDGVIDLIVLFLGHGNGVLR